MSRPITDTLRQSGVLIVTQQLRSVRSGVGTYARTLVAGLAAEGVPLTIATWADECDPERCPDAAWWSLGAPPRFDPTPGAFHALGRRIARRLGRFSGRFAVAHFLDAREGHATLARPALRRVAARFVGTVHDDYALRTPRGWFALRGQAADPLKRQLYYAWLRGLERRCLPRFDALATNSAATTAAIVDGYGIDRSRCAVVPLTIDPLPEVEPADLAGAPRLLFIGGNFFRKGLDAVIDALPILRHEHPSLVLHVAGHDPARAVLERRAAALGVADAVVWHGRVDTPRCAALLRAADALVVPSRTEALGLVYLEAFAAGVPAISGLGGGAPEIVRHGYSGLCAATRGDDVAAAVHRVLADPALADRLREGGRRVLAERTVEALVAATLRSYVGDRLPAVDGHGAPGVPITVRAR